MARHSITPCEHPPNALEWTDSGLRCLSCKGRWVVEDPSQRFFMERAIKRFEKLEVFLGEILTATGHTLCTRCESVTALEESFEPDEQMAFCCDCLPAIAPSAESDDEETVAVRGRLAAHLKHVLALEPGALTDETLVLLRGLEQAAPKTWAAMLAVPIEAGPADPAAVEP